METIIDKKEYIITEMCNDFSEIANIIQIKTILFALDILDEYRFFLFGSRAIGKHNKYSDYDIGVIGEKPLSAEVMLELQEKFENVPALIDLVDFAFVTPEFKNEAMKKIIWLTSS